jgi:hypothetical protein
MWFEYKKSVAPIYQDETYRRMFATASGARRRKNRKAGDGDGEDKSWFARLTERLAGRTEEPREPTH